MKYRYIVLGAGRQGTAIAYDFIVNGEAESVTLCDNDSARVHEATKKINSLTGTKRAQPRILHASDDEAVHAAIAGHHVVVSALPYFLNLRIAKAAIDEKAHFCDLGGNTEVVMKELRLDASARKASVSILPDCGLAPGLSNLLAARALRKLGKADVIRVRCGGLPQKPKPPFGYKMVFSLFGLINEYCGEAIVIRNGKIVRVPALSEVEEITIPGLGKLEAAVTTGGTSTAPYSFKGQVKNFDYKTLRYPGHWDAMRAFSDLGLFSEELLSLKTGYVSPREVMISLLEPLIRFDRERDLVVLLVEAELNKNSKKKKYRALLIDHGDQKTGFSAMERTTGYPTSTIAHLQAQGRIASGATPIERSVPLDDLMDGLTRRGIEIAETLK